MSRVRRVGCSIGTWSLLTLSDAGEQVVRNGVAAAAKRQPDAVTAVGERVAVDVGIVRLHHSHPCVLHVVDDVV